MQTDSVDEVPFPFINLERFRVRSSDTEISQVQQYIRDAKHSIHHINVEIDELYQAILVLEERRSPVHRLIDRYRAFVSSIRKVPSEIWNEIFSWHLHNSHGLRVAAIDILTPTLDLARVCSSWRETVLSTPKLWADLDVNLAYFGTEMTNFVALYLNRSKNHPLTLKLTAMPIRGSDTSHLAIPWGWKTFQVLLDNHARWLKVEINLRWEILGHRRVQDLLRDISTRCEMLREISLRFGHVPPPLGAVFESSALFRLLEQAPQLRSLDIDEFGALLTLPFSQLLTIRSTFWSLGQLSQCFVMCRSLQKADIFIEDFDVSGFRSRQIYHAGLRALKCTFKRGQNVADVLSTLMLPAINELELSITLLGTIRSSPASALKNMLLESGCRLEKLKLGADFYTSDQELIDILTITPTLTHFELETFDCTVDLFHGLTFRDNVSTILPCLTSLSLRILWLYSTHSRSLSPVPEPEAILSMVQSRRSTDEMAGKAKLTYFGFSARVALAQVANRGWTNLFYSITMPGLRVLEKNGLKLKMQVTVNA